MISALARGLQSLPTLPHFQLGAWLDNPITHDSLPAPPCPVPPLPRLQAALERLLRQALAAHGCLRELRGGRGTVLRFDNYLLGKSEALAPTAAGTQLAGGARVAPGGAGAQAPAGEEAGGMEEG